MDSPTKKQIPCTQDSARGSVAVFISVLQVVYAACRSGTTARGRLDPAVHDEVTCTPLVRGRGVSSYELPAAALITWNRAVSALAWAKLTQAFDMSSRSSASQISPISIVDGVYTKSTSDDLTWLSGALTASVRLRRMYVALHTFLRILSTNLPPFLKSWNLGRDSSRLPTIRNLACSSWDPCSREKKRALGANQSCSHFQVISLLYSCGGPAMMCWLAVPRIEPAPVIGI
jgi:hypothetical protein